MGRRKGVWEEGKECWREEGGKECGEERREEGREERKECGRLMRGMWKGLKNGKEWKGVEGSGRKWKGVEGSGNRINDSEYMNKNGKKSDI